MEEDSKNTKVRHQELSGLTREQVRVPEDIAILLNQSGAVADHNTVFWNVQVTHEFNERIATLEQALNDSQQRLALSVFLSVVPIRASSIDFLLKLLLPVFSSGDFLFISFHFLFISFHCIFSPFPPPSESSLTSERDGLLSRVVMLRSELTKMKVDTEHSR